MIFLSRVPLRPWISCLVFRGDAAARCCPRSRGREVKIQSIFTRVILSVAKCESATLESIRTTDLYFLCVLYEDLFFLSHNRPSVETVKLTERIRTAAKKVEVRIAKKERVLLATWGRGHTPQTKQLPNSCGDQLGDVTRLKRDVELKWLKKVRTSQRSRRSSSGCLNKTTSVDVPPNTKFTDAVLKHNIRIKTSEAAPEARIIIIPCSIH